MKARAANRRCLGKAQLRQASGWWRNGQHGANEKIRRIKYFIGAINTIGDFRAQSCRNKRNFSRRISMCH